MRDVFAELGVELTPEIAEALYIALVTDTGRFQYANTTPKALRLAAELVEAGADVHRVFQGVYENVQFAKLKLLARALERAQVYEGGALVVSFLLRNDFAEVGAAEPYSEGIIDYLRAVEGALVSVLIREPPRSDGPTRRVSLRSSTDEIDVSAIARKSSGGGHRQAAGFSSEASIDEITDFIRREYLAQVGPQGRLSLPASSSLDKPAGPSSFKVIAGAAPAHRRADRSRGHARSVRHGAAARSLGLGDEAPAVLRRAGQALRHRRRPVVDDVDRRSRGRGRRAARAAGAGRARGAASRRSAARSSCRFRPPRP